MNNIEHISAFQLSLRLSIYGASTEDATVVLKLLESGDFQAAMLAAKEALAEASMTW